MYDHWIYKGHECRIWGEESDGCIKAWHQVTTPDGRVVFADISPYIWKRKVVEMWIDAGYPKRLGGWPLNEEDLEKIGPMPRLTAAVVLGIKI